MTTDTKRKPEDKIAEPPKKWRNWYKCTKSFYYASVSRHVSKGEVFSGAKLWPSKDVAETTLARLPLHLNAVANGLAVYLGAEPEQ